MSHPGQQPSDFGLADDLTSFDGERPPQRRSTNPTGRRQGPGPGPYTYTHQQLSSQQLNAPWSNEFGQTAFGLPPAVGSTQAFPPFDAWADIPPQNNYQNLADNAFQSPLNVNLLYPASIPGSMQDPQGRPPLQAPFDWNAPVIDYTQFGYPSNNGRPVGTQADWFNPAWDPQSDLMNQVPSPPTYDTCPAPVLDQSSHYQPTINAPFDVFTAEELDAASACALPTQTYSGNTSVHGSAENQKRKQGAAMTCDVGSADHGARTELSNAARTGQEVIRASPPKKKIARPLSKRRFDPGPTYDGVLRKGDNLRLSIRQARIVEFPQDPLSLALMTNFPPASMKFLDSRPDPHDISKLPFSNLKTGLLIIGVFDEKVSMCYIHSASPSNLTPVQKIEICDSAVRLAEERLSEKGNEIISLFQNSRRWTTLLPKSTTEKSNGVVTLQKRNSRSVSNPGNHYTEGDIQQASLCVAAAALSTFFMSCRPVFDKETYDRIRTGAQTIFKPAACLPSGVNNLSPDELRKLIEVPPEWGNRQLPPLWIAGQLVGADQRS